MNLALAELTKVISLGEDFEEWHERVGVLIKDLFGDDSLHYKAFESIEYSPPMIWLQMMRKSMNNLIKNKVSHNLKREYLTLNYF